MLTLSLPAYHRATSSGLLFFITVLTVCVCHGTEQGGPSSVSCYQCGSREATAFPDTPWNCTKNRSFHTITIQCTLFAERCHTVSIRNGQACIAGVFPPICSDPDSRSSGLANYVEVVGAIAAKNDCSLVMSEAEYNNTIVLIPCHCTSDLCNERFTITVVLPTPPLPTLPPDANNTAFGNTTQATDKEAVLSPADYAAIALGIIVICMIISLVALVGGLCYRFRQKRRLQRRRIALMKSKFEPTPLHQ